MKVTAAQFSTIVKLKLGGDFELACDNQDTLAITPEGRERPETIYIDPDGSYKIMAQGVL